MILNKYNALFVALIVFCAIAIVWDSSAPLMSGDDIEFYATLANGESVWHGCEFAIGRFFPLAGWNLNLTALFSINPYAFMIFNALCFVATAWCFWCITRDFSPKMRVICFVIFTFSVGAVKIYTQITFPETLQITFIMLFFTLTCALFSANPHTNLAMNLNSANLKRGGAEWDYKIAIIFAIALICANIALYLKEVSFVIIGGFGFFYLALSLIAGRKQKHKRAQIIAIFCALLMLSSLVFLGAYFYFTLGASGKYGEFGVFSSIRTAVVAILGTPLVSIALPIMIVIRIYRVVKGDKIHPFYDSLGLCALFYFMAFLVLGMGSFHYFVVPNLLSAIYGAFFINRHFDLMKCFWIRAVCVIIALIFATSCLPQSIHYYTLNKIQNKNLNDGFAFLGAYISANQGKTTIYFDGFCRGIDRCYNSWGYPAVFSILPKLHGVRNFDIKSAEPNGKIFSIDSHSNLSFFNSESVEVPQSGDLIALFYMSDKFMNKSYIDSLKARYTLIFETQNRGYFPNYNAMSLGAWLLKKYGINHALNNMGNIFKMPKQFYVFRVE